MYLMVLDGEYPKDIRVRKEAESIAESGREITVLTRWSKNQARKEVINNVNIIRCGPHYSFNIKGINDILSSVFFIDFLFWLSIKKILKINNVRVIHLHDLPLIKTIQTLIKKKDVKLILDMHENYPEMLDEYKLSKKGWLKRNKDALFFNSFRWKKYEGRHIKKCDHIIAVVDEMKEKIIREYNIDSQNISVVSNYEKRSFSHKEENDDFTFDQTFSILYVGGISPIRGLETVILAIKKINKHFPVRFVIVGGGNNQYIQTLKNLVSENELDDCVHFIGYRPFNKINYYIKRASINIIPHIKSAHTDNTIPHKLFQIFLMKSPVLVSSCNPLNRIVKSNNAGYVFKAESPTSLKEMIVHINKNKEEKTMFANNGYDLAYHKLNWELEAKKLINTYDRYHG
tara:strand:+ start:532 stop:1734 length:1203 start_codon:yes stop_codon:yes gene_type:complete